MSIAEVSPNALIRQLSEELKKLNELAPPQWSIFTKTGVHKERPPEQPDWWYIRAASILRRIYIDGPVGISRLRSFYGGGQHRGQVPTHFKKAGGKIIRVILQQLEKAGLVSKAGQEGRKLSTNGVIMVEDISKKIKSEGKA